MCGFCWKTADLLCLDRLNAALDDWHSETRIEWSVYDVKENYNCGGGFDVSKLRYYRI